MTAAVETRESYTDRVVMLHEAGVPIRAIATMTDSDPAVVVRSLRRAGVDVGPTEAERAKERARGTRSRGVPLPDEDERTIVRLAQEGLSHRQIAEQVGRHVHTVARVLSRRSVSQATIDRIATLYREGETRADIARRCGVALSTVDRVARKAGVRRVASHNVQSELRVPVPRFDDPACAGRTDMVPDSEDPALVRRQVAVCEGCKHRIECLSWAIDARVHGIWGGHLTSAREEMRKERKKS